MTTELLWERVPAIRPFTRPSVWGAQNQIESYERLAKLFRELGVLFGAKNSEYI
jgi:hypothetical protein